MRNDNLKAESVEIDPADETPAEKTINDIMAAFNNSGDDEWYVKVYEVMGNNKHGYGEKWLFNCSPEELPIEERLRDEFGPGQYRARVMRNKRPFKILTVDIGGRAKPAGTSGSGDISALVAAIEAGNARTMAMVERMLDAQRQQVIAPVPSIDPLAALEKMSTIMANLHQAAPANTGIADAIAMLTKGLEMGQTMMKSGGETGFLDVVKGFVESPAMAGLLGSFAARAQAAQPGAVTVPPQQILPPVMPPNGTEGMTEQQIAQMLRQQLAFLVSKAKANRDPEQYAEFVLDNVPDATIQYMLNNNNIIGELTQFNGEIGNYIPWFEAMLVSMREMYQSGAEQTGEIDAAGGAPEPNPNDPGRPGGNPAHAGPHAGPGRAVP